MATKGRVTRAVVASANLQSQTAGATLHWDSRSGVRREVRPPTCPGPAQPSLFQASGPPARVHRARPCWTTAAIGLVPALSPQTIEWEQEAARVTFDLDRVLLAAIAPGAIPSATGELMWGPCQTGAESCPLAVHPMLLMHATDEWLQADRVTIVPILNADDPLLQHLALVLQAAIEGESAAGRLYAESLIDALVVHFLRRYAAAQQPLCEGTGGLSPYKLRRTIAYIKAHLAQELSLATLAAVAQTSPAHFARLFKRATRMAPHQYVIRCRMAHAQRLLAETDVPLSDIGLQVGCADQSHFTALFRTHAFPSSKAFRDQARRA
ncbi:MAG TPA: AraC family transcriptional regulator [Candidatus Tectomicrobia bacterium]|nr:AraC family transcriptional regulator [Candidatus Tectomicrobia bacterium]